jgi:hypothetical protein
MRSVAAVVIPSGLMVVVCTEPNDAYSSKDGKHMGHIRDGKFIPAPKSEAIATPKEQVLIMRAYYALTGALHNLHGTQPMKKLSELTEAERCEPSSDYPGEYVSYLNGQYAHNYSTYEEAHRDALLRYHEASGDNKFAEVCWRASSNDPRIGQPWFHVFVKVTTVP